MRTIKIYLLLILITMSSSSFSREMGYITYNPVKIKSKPSYQSKTICTVRGWQIINVYEKKNGWRKTDVCGKKGYIESPKWVKIFEYHDEISEPTDSYKLPFQKYKKFSYKKLEKKYHSGDNIAARELGIRNYYGINGAKLNPAGGFSRIWSAAQAGDSESQYFLGLHYSRKHSPYPYKIHDEGVDINKAIEWLGKAVKQRHKKAQLLLASLQKRPSKQSAINQQGGHSHNGRFHKHPLPATGIHHRHGNGAYGVSVSNNVVSSKKTIKGKSIASTEEPWKVKKRDLIRFVKNNNYNSLIYKRNSGVGVDAMWYPASGNRNVGVNGEGKIKLLLEQNRKYEVYPKILGLFENGQLVGNGELNIRVRQCYDRGLMFCSSHKDATSRRSINLNSNLRKMITRDVGKLKAQLSGRAPQRYSNTYTPPRSSESSSSSSRSRKQSTSKSTVSKPKVKKIYIGSHSSGRAQYVIECRNGSSYSSINQKSNGFWYSYSSNMGSNYKNLSIEGVANKRCN